MQRLFGIVGMVAAILTFSVQLCWAQVPFTNPYRNPYGGQVPKPAVQPSSTPTNTAKPKPSEPATTQQQTKPKQKNNSETQADNQAQPDLRDAAETQDISTDEKVDEKEAEEALQAREKKFVIYGQSFLNAQSSAIRPSLENNFTSPPASYKLGAGDELIVNVWGTSNIQETYKIGKDGSIFPRATGRISLAGLSFSSAQQILQRRFKQVLAQGAQVDVQLAATRSIKVTTMGEVKLPGTVTVSAFNTAFNVITMCGGVTDLANLREIQIRRNGMLVRTIDLYEFLASGEIDDAYLEDGDIILINVYEKKVQADGKFKRPMFYLLRENEDLTDLIRYAGGATYDARFSSIQIQTVQNERPVIYSLNLRDIDAAGQTISLKDGDIVKIKPINMAISNTVSVSGAVMYPDDYQVEPGDKLLSVINKAGGILTDALSNTIFVYRGDSTINAEAFKVDLSTLTATSNANIDIMPGDKVVVVSKNGLTGTYNVEISGMVQKQGKQRFLSGMTVRDLIIMAGGFLPEALSSRIEIARAVDTITNSYSLKMLPNGQVKIFTVGIDDNLDNTSGSDFKLQPFDHVFVRGKPEYRTPSSVIITGEVLYPGRYSLTEANEMLSSLIKRSGGYTKNAFIQGASLYRKDIGPVLIKLDSISNKDVANNLDIKLVNNDSIFIPTILDLVSVQGAVQNPINIKAISNSGTVMSYISAAGGFNDRPWKSRIYVTYPNGASKRTKNFLGMHFYPPVPPGSAIYVPKKPEPTENGWNWRETQAFVVSMLSIVTTAITTYAILNPPQ